MKKRNKKNCNLIRWRRMAEHVVKGYGVAYVTGEPQAQIIDVKRMRHLPQAPIELVRAISDYPHYWTVCMSALWVDENGKQRYEHDIQTMAVRYMQKSLVEHLNTEHQRLIARIDKGNLWAAAWIAIPEKTDITGVQVDEIYNLIGAWDGKY